MLLNELNNTSWISSGTDRKMSRIPPIGQLIHHGEPALTRPNNTPRLVPMATEAKVMLMVVTAPFNIKRMSFQDSEEPKYIILILNNETSVTQPAAHTM